MENSIVLCTIPFLLIIVAQIYQVQQNIVCKLCRGSILLCSYETKPTMHGQSKPATHPYNEWCTIHLMPVRESVVDERQTELTSSFTMVTHFVRK
jgi:hypothetical protein